MAKYQYEYNEEGKVINLPFEHDWTVEDYGGNKEEMEAELDVLVDDYNREFKRDVDRTAAGVDKALRNQPRAFDPDIAAIRSSNKEDRKRGYERLAERQVIDDQLKKGALTGDPNRKREFADRAATFQRHLDRDRKEKPYKYVEAVDRASIEDAIGQIKEYEKLSPAKVKEFRGQIEGHVEAFNETNNGEFSYVIDSTSPYDPHRSGEPRVIRINHPSHKGHDVAKKANSHNLSTLDYIVGKLGQGKASPRKEETPRAEVKPKETEKKSLPFEKTIRPGLLPGRR